MSEMDEMDKMDEMDEMDEMSRAERIWTRADWMVGLVAAFVAGVVYFWTAAPNVTLLDSGEFVVAAQHFGVPHPTGYPLWTLLAKFRHFLKACTNFFSDVPGCSEQARLRP